MGRVPRGEIVALSFAKAERLRDRLIRVSQDAAASDSDMLRSACLESPALRDPLLAQAIAQVAAHLHHPSSPEVRHLARGILALALGFEVEPTLEDEVTALVEFALTLMDRAGTTSPATLYLDEPSRGAALSLLERCCSASADDDARVQESASAYLESAGRLAEGMLFSRLLGDLSFLTDVLADPARPAAEKWLARGALVYFAEAKDAIDDDLGLVGKLDDAFVARFVAEQIDPERQARNLAIDGMLVRWPFLDNLRLTIDGADWAPSSITMLNLAIAFHGSSKRSALVVPRIGVLPSMLGTVAALGRLYDRSQQPEPFRPAVGSYVTPLGMKEQIQVLGYTDAQGQPTSPDQAVRVCLGYLPAGKGEAVRHSKLVSALDRYVLAPEPTRRRRTTLDDAKENLRLGPLERLFGVEHPVALDGPIGRVVVVARLGSAERLLTNLELHGVRLGDVLPTGRFDAETRPASWSKCGGSPLLLVARDLSEAAAAIERMDGDIDVLAPLETAERDEGALDRVLERGARVTAICPQRATEVQSHLARRGFEFLDWSQPVVTHAWSVAGSDGEPRESHPFLVYESTLASDLARRVVLTELRVAEVDSAFEGLLRLRDGAGSDYGEEMPPALVEWIDSAWSLFFALDGLPVPIGRLSEGGASRASRAPDLVHALRAAEGSWLARSRAEAREALARLVQMAETLRETNPKYEALSEAVRARPSARVACSDEAWNELRAIGAVQAQARFPEVDDAGGIVPVVRFEWPGRSKLPRLLLPPVGNPAVFIFYGWEAVRCRRVLDDRARQLDSHRRGDRQAKVLAEGSKEDTVSPPAVTFGSNSGPDADELLEEWLHRVQRTRFVSRVDAARDAEERVQARLIRFAGARYAFYTATHRVLTASHILDQLGGEAAELREKSIAELRPGDVVVLVEGSDRDVLRERADQRLPRGSRSVARAWHRALRRAQERLGSEAALCRAIVAGGCSVTEQTVRAWIRSGSQIGPQEDADLDVIARVTADAELLGCLEGCRSAIALVRGEHLRVSEELARRVKDRLRAALAEGTPLDDAIRLDDQLSVLRLERIDDESVLVPHSVVNRVQGMS